MRGIKKLRRMAKGQDPAVPNLLTDIGNLYLAAMVKRYKKFSKGGGHWHKLDAETVKRKGNKKNKKRKRQKVTVNQKKTGGPTAILVDNGLMIQALAPGGNGQQVRRIGPMVVRAGYSESKKHAGTNMTFAKLAEIHQNGNKDLPARPILVEPDDATKRRMLLLIGKVIEKVGAV